MTRNFVICIYYQKIIRFVKSRRSKRWEGFVARVGERRNAYKSLVGNSEGKNVLTGPSFCRWEDNMSTDFR
jgi:hypothetical protein